MSTTTAESKQEALAQLDAESKKRKLQQRAKARAKAQKLKNKQKQLEQEQKIIESFELKPGEKIFEISKWHAIALWEYDVLNATCAICKENLHNLCVQCAASTVVGQSNDEQCSVSWGKCGHAYHYHCIKRWLEMKHQQHNKCPHCAKDWEFKN